MKCSRRAPGHDQAAIRVQSERRDGTLDLARIPHVDRTQVHAKRRRHSLDRAELARSGRYGRIAQDRRSRYARGNVLEQLQPFPGDGIFEVAKAGDIAAGPRQAIDVAGPDRVGDDREHDRHAAGRLQQGCDGGAAIGQDDVWSERDQFRREFADVAGISPAPARLDSHVAAVGPAQLLQRLHESR